MKTSPSGDLYKILGIASTASAGEIKAAYRRLAMQHHPDRQKGGDSSRFQEINQAYQVLSDPIRRRRYDGSRAAGSDSSFSAAPWANSADVQAAYTSPKSRSTNSTRTSSANGRTSSTTHQTTNERRSAKPGSRTNYQTNAKQEKASTGHQRDGDHAYTQRKANQAYEKWTGNDNEPRRSQNIDEALLWYRLWIKTQRQIHAKHQQKAKEAPKEQAPTQPPETEIGNYQCQRCGTRYHLLQQRRFFNLQSGVLHKSEGYYCQLCTNIIHFKSSAYSLLLQSWQHWKGPFLGIRAVLGNIHQPEKEQNAYLAYQFAGQRTKLGYTQQAKEAFILAHKLSKDSYFRHLIEDSMQRQFGWSARYLSWRAYRKRLLWLSLLLGIIVFWLANSEWRPPQSPNHSAEIVAHQSPAPPERWHVPLGHVPQPLANRTDKNYTLTEVQLFQGPHQESPVVATLPEYTEVRVAALPTFGQWLTVEANIEGEIVSGYVAEHLIGIGDANYAQQHQCNRYPPPPPTHGAIIFGHLIGKTGAANFRPLFTSAAVISLYDQNDELSHQVYLAEKAKNPTEIRLVTGTYRIKVATGEIYNADCQLFMRSAQSYWLPDPISISSSHLAQLRIPPFIGQPL